MPHEDIEFLDPTKLSAVIQKYKARKLKSAMQKDWEKVEIKNEDVRSLYSRLSNGVLMIYRCLF